MDTGEQWFTPEKQTLYDLLRDVNAQLGGDDTAAAILSELSTRVRELAAAATEPAPLAAAPAFLAAVLADVAKRAAHFEQTGSTIMGHSTGFPRLDDLLGGLEPGRVTILQAAPGTGKTTLSNQIAYNVASHGAPVLYISFENHPEDLTLKTLCRLAGVSVSQASKGLIQPEKLAEAARTFQARAGTLYYVVGNGSTTMESIRATLRTIMRTHPDAGHPVIFLDYLQRLAKAATGPGRGEDLFSQVTRTSGQLSTLANETGAHVLAISSMNRESYKNAAAKNGLTSGKGSGDLEYDAAHVLALNVDEKNATPDSNTDCLHLGLIKNRYGAVGGLTLGRDRTTLRIAEVDHRGPNRSTGLGDRVRSNGGR